MENLLFSFNAVIPVFLIVAVGYFAKVRGLVDDHFVDVATRFNFKLGLPMVVFSNIYQSELHEMFNPKLVGFIVLGILGWVAVLMMFCPLITKDKRKISALVQTIYRTNVLLMGVPLAINMLGEENIGPLILILPISIPLFNILAVVVLMLYQVSDSGSFGARMSKTIKGIVTNPLIIGSVLGVILKQGGIELPFVLDKAIVQLAELATPLALITLGAQFSFRGAWGNLKYSMFATVTRLVIIPVIMVGLGYLCEFNRSELGAIFIVFAAPTATASYVMAKEMDSDYQLTGDVVLLTTFFSMFTMFIGIYLMKSLGLI